MKARRSEVAAILAAAAMLCTPCFAETFSTFCTPGQSVLNTNTLAFANGLSVGGNGQYTAVGIQNGYNVDTVKVQDFYEYPKEREGMSLIVK